METLYFNGGYAMWCDWTVSDGLRMLPMQFIGVVVWGSVSKS